MVKKTVVKKRKTFKPGSIIIDALNGQLMIYEKDNYNGMVRYMKVRGDKALISKAITLGLKNRVKVYDKYTATNLNFKKLLKNI